MNSKGNLWYPYKPVSTTFPPTRQTIRRALKRQAMANVKAAHPKMLRPARRAMANALGNQAYREMKGLPDPRAK